MNGLMEWIAAGGTIIAAALVASDLGRRWSGAGFILFSVVSVLWVWSGLSSPEGRPIAIQNGVLLLINLWGVWRFLISPRNTAVIDRMEAVAPVIAQKVDAEIEADGAPRAVSVAGAA